MATIVEKMQRPLIVKPAGQECMVCASACRPGEKLFSGSRQVAIAQA
jgi:hypothetical protein